MNEDLLGSVPNECNNSLNCFQRSIKSILRSKCVNSSYSKQVLIQKVLFITSDAQTHNCLDE